MLNSALMVSAANAQVYERIVRENYMLCPLEVRRTPVSLTWGKLPIRSRKLVLELLIEGALDNESSNCKSSMKPFPSFKLFVKAARHRAISSESLT
jgi:hypothetical protein